VSVLSSSYEFFLTFGSKNSQKRATGGYRYSSFARLGVRNCDQYYTIGTTTLFFYDYLLTLGDEVSHATGVTSRYTYLCERSNTLGPGRNHGVRGGQTRNTESADDKIVFALFILVRHLLRILFHSERGMQNRYLPMLYQFWVLVCE